MRKTGMNLRQLFITLALLGAGGAYIAGCGGSSPPAVVPTTAPSTGPQAPPVTSAASTEPYTEITLAEPPATQPATEPAQCQLIIGQKQFWFPPAVLHFSSSKGRVSARLITDDPPAAIETGYHGNSFDLIMALDIADPQQIDGATWTYAAPSTTGSEESAHGIFLDGQRQRLHPQQVTAQFSKQGDKVIVQLSGWFSYYDSSLTDRSFGPPKRIRVDGTLETNVSAQ
jgi:hypothetical protein